MFPDTIANAPASNPKDFAKKKRTNRSAKLRQCKLDARREQWLSQVKNKGCKDEPNSMGEQPMHVQNKKSGALENLDMVKRGGKFYESIHHARDVELSPSNSPTSPGSVLGLNNSGTNFSGSSSSSSSSGSTGGCYSGNITEEDEDDGCLDDWEAIADALAADDKQEKHEASDSTSEQKLVLQSSSQRWLGSRVGPRTEKLQSGRSVPKVQGASWAWRPDDVLRPQSLPNLFQQRSFPINSGRHCRHGHGPVAWAYAIVSSAPTSCPICFEDFDITDSSFLPCRCGFRLCLFCHKRILEEDGRCPGCRKPYDQDTVEHNTSLNGGGLTFQLARSCSMVSRS